MKRLAMLATLTAALGLPLAPAAAQDAPGEKMSVVDVYGSDPCPPSTADVILVCRRLDEADRYRIPEPLRQSDSPQNQAWANRVRAFETVGDFGPLSCSPVGMGGELGCTAEMIAQAYAERRSGPGIRAAELIAAAREERLATIDAEAADTQSRVEELERQYMERAEAADGTPASAPRTATGAVVVEPSEVTQR